MRALLLPLTLKQFKSMQALQRLAPEIKALQAKYKDDKQRQQQEMMKFYQENKVNPFGLLPAARRCSCRSSSRCSTCCARTCKHDICPGIRSRRNGTLRDVSVCAADARGSARVPLHPGPDRQGDRRACWSC